MKKIILSALAIGSVCTFAGTAVYAGDDTLTRRRQLERENTAIRKENAALLENKTLRERNAALKSSVVQPPVISGASVPAEKRSDPFGAYAADLPLAYKARPIETPGQFRIWGEGGAIWTGGDPVTSDYSISDFNSLLGLLGGSSRTFDLTPKVGWEAAAGFDYRFAASPWHVSGQFRYGEGKARGSDASAGSIDPALLVLIGLPAGSSFSGSESVAASYKETHWLADLAVGYDILGSGPAAMQVKGGLRIAELVGQTNTSENTSFALGLGAPIVLLGVPIDSFGLNTSALTSLRNSFFGAGPRIGIEGSVPFAGSWAFDYLGDAAVLFGNQKLTTRTTSTTSVSPGILAALLGNPTTTTTATDQRYATVFNADIQVGVSYWVTQNVKLSASYRLDAFFNVSDDTTGTPQTVNRYIHGPRLGVSATF
jgi:opacity protein-like surface antigen